MATDENHSGPARTGRIAAPREEDVVTHFEPLKRHCTRRQRPWAAIPRIETRAAIQRAIRWAASTTSGIKFPSGPARRATQNLISVLRVIVTLLVTPAGPPLA